MSPLRLYVIVLVYSLVALGGHWAGAQTGNVFNENNNDNQGVSITSGGFDHIDPDVMTNEDNDTNYVYYDSPSFSSSESLDNSSSSDSERYDEEAILMEVNDTSTLQWTTDVETTTVAETTEGAPVEEELPEIAEPEVEPEPKPKPVEPFVPAEVPAWSYDGEDDADEWGEIDESCRPDVQDQSPIQIICNQTIFVSNLDPIKFEENINRRHTQAWLRNTGYAVNLVVPHEALVVGAGLPSRRFLVAGITFRWANDDKTTGSEHAINGIQGPLEMQVVSYDAHTFSSAEEAAITPGGIAIISVLFKLSEEDNPALSPVISNLKFVTKSGSERQSPNVELNSLLPDTSKYYNYQGSLSAPPCTGGVKWSVLYDRLEISEAQLEKFYGLQRNATGDDVLIGRNDRPTQPIGNRVVYRSFLYREEISYYEVVESDFENSAMVPSLAMSTLLVTLVATLQQLL